MSFEIFRRNQKKVLAALAILAMFLFTIDQSVWFFLRDKTQNVDKVEVELFGKKVYASELGQMQQERMIANRFVDAFFRLKYRFGWADIYGVEPFGQVSTRDAVDAFILQRKAEELGIPASKEMALDFLRDQARVDLDSATDIRILSEAKKMVASDYPDDAIMHALANQYRISLVRQLTAGRPFTPLDLFRGFRNRHEQVAANAVGLPVADYVKDVTAQPSDADLKALYETGKNVIASPDLPQPGFKVPRKVREMHINLNAKALGDKIRTELFADGKELQKLFETRKPELIKEIEDRIKSDIDANRSPEELPVQVFTPLGSNQPKANLPTQTDLPFASVANRLADELVRQKVDAVVTEKFERVDSKVTKPFRDANDMAETKFLDQRDAEAEKAGKKTEETDSDAARPTAEQLWTFGLSDAVKKISGDLGLSMPEPRNLAEFLVEATKKAAQSEPDVTFGASPLLDTSKLTAFGDISQSRYGDDYLQAMVNSSDTFEKLIFDTGELYLQTPLVDPEGRRYWMWRIDETPERVPGFEEVKDEVKKVWVFDQARKIAQTKADDLAKQAREKKGDLRAIAGDRPVKELPLTTKIQGAPGAYRLAALSAIDEHTGDKLRDAVFNLTPGEIAVAPNQPETIYYVVAYHSAIASSVNDLASTANERDVQMARNELTQTHVTSRVSSWLEELRKSAGLSKDWEPSDEARARTRRSSNRDSNQPDVPRPASSALR